MLMREHVIVRFDRVTKQYGRVTALRDVNLEVYAGEFVSLLGPSGCGKTTTLRLIAGFIEPDRGRLFIEDKDVTGVPAFKRPVNTVFQNYALFPHMTVAANVGFGPRMRGVPSRDVDRLVNEALEMVALTGYRQALPRQLSGGQQQRVALARALVNQPKVLLLDEPLGALDLKLRRQMQMELKRLHEQLKLTFVYVTHDQIEALTMSDRIVVMNKGVIEQIGAGTDIYEWPQSRFVADFIGDTNLLECRVESVDRDQVRLVHPTGTLSAARVAGDTIHPGQAVSLSIRPERIRVTNGGCPFENRWSGIIQRKLRLGAEALLYVAFPEGTILQVRLTDASLADGVEQGHSVVVGWRPQDVRILTQ
jgi:spermidine/putrescine transport system ATP-binding protein